MTEEESKALAAQLRQPKGDMGIQVGERMNAGNQFMNLNTIEQIQPTPNDKILEIGMGNGFFVKDILQIDSTLTYSGCDFSELMVTEAIKQNEKWIENKRAAFYHTSASSLPFENKLFNTIFTINTLYFWEEPEKELVELKRVLADDGKLIITIRPKKYMHHFEFTKHGFKMYSEEEAIRLLTENGWKVEASIEKIDPPIDWFGEKLEPESLILIAKKNENK